MARILIAFFLGLGTAATLAQTDYPKLIVLNGVDPDGRMAAIRVDSVGHVICSKESK